MTSPRPTDPAIAAIRDAVEATAAGGLDEVGRKRIERGLADRLDQLQTPRRRPRLLPWAAAAALLVGVLGLVIVVVAGRDRRVPPRPVPSLDLLVPFAAGGLHGPAMGQRTRSLALPSAGRVHASVLDGVGQITLVGPARLSVERTTSDGLALRLERGLLLARVNHTGRGLVVRAPGAEVRVVGTVFAVDARSATQVAVAEGVVQTRRPGGRWVRVTAGRAWSSGTSLETRAIPAAMRRMLDDRPAAPSAESRPASRPVRPRAVAGAEGIYARAEAALRASDRARAERLLDQVARRFPGDPLAAAARYELARLAHRRGDLKAARASAVWVIERGKDPSLRDPAHFLLCRVEIDARRTDRAIACLLDFRRAFPASPHDQEALVFLGDLHLLRGGCTAARLWLERYLSRYPNGAYAGEVAGRRARCAPAR